MSLPAIFSTISQGVYIVSVVSPEAAARPKEDRSTSGHNAFTAAAVIHVSFDPLLLALSINHQHSSYKLLRESDLCVINVIPKDRVDLVSHFATRPPDGEHKLDKVTWWRSSNNGAAIIEGCLAFFECKAVSYTDGGDHMLVVLKVTNAALEGDTKREPLLYRDVLGVDQSESLYPKHF